MVTILAWDGRRGAAGAAGAASACPPSNPHYLSVRARRRGIGKIGEEEVLCERGEGWREECRWKEE